MFKKLKQDDSLLKKIKIEKYEAITNTIYNCTFYLTSGTYKQFYIKNLICTVNIIVLFASCILLEAHVS